MINTGDKMRDKYVYLFEVIHRHIIEMDHQNQPICDSKFIGLYSHKKQAESAVERFKTLPGFVLYPSGFCISRKACYISDGYVQKMPGAKVYMPYHEYYIPEEDCDYCTRGNYFYSRQEAEKVLDQWKNDKILSLHPKGFSICEYTLDFDCVIWNEGFD